MKKILKKTFSYTFCSSFLFLGIFNLSTIISPSSLEGETFFKPLVISEYLKTEEQKIKESLPPRSIAEVFTEIQKLGPYTNLYCNQEKRISQCYVLLGYAISKKDWALSNIMTNSLCRNHKSPCKLKKFVSMAQKQFKLYKDINNFQTPMLLSFVHDHTLDKAGLSASGVLCAYLEENYKTPCYFQKNKLKFTLSEEGQSKLKKSCYDNKEPVSCWTLAYEEQKRFNESHLMQACLNDSAPACYYLAETYQKRKFNSLSKRYFEKACALNLKKACVSLSQHYKQAGVTDLQNYYLGKALDQEGLRKPANR
ncbi:MAG: hypothetical protein ACPGJV_13235 [Bacteriovoracaceae bacterium]